MGIIKCVCTTKERKARTWNVGECYLDEQGFQGDIHYGMEKKAPVSMLPYDVIKTYFEEKQQEISYGRFGENLLIEGLDWNALKVGDRLECGDVILEIVRIDASCPAADAYQGEKVCYPMEPYFVFCKVCRGGLLKEDLKITYI